MNIKKFTQKNADGSSFSYEFDVPPVESIPHPGKPKGTDTVPAWLTPGEYVVNAEATRMYGPQIEAMNNAGRVVQAYQGGTIPEYKYRGGCTKAQYKAKGGKPCGCPECSGVSYKAVGGDVEPPLPRNPNGYSGVVNDLGDGTYSLTNPDGHVVYKKATRDEVEQHLQKVNEGRFNELNVPDPATPIPPAPQKPPQQPSSYLDKLEIVESSGRSDAKNPNSSATGLHQFTEGTWVDIVKKNEPDLANSMSEAELLELRKDPEVSRRMVGYLTEENRKSLQNKDLDTSDGSLYLSHFLGAGNASKTLQAQPNTPIAEVLPKEVIDANKSVLENKTVGEVKAWAQSKMGNSTSPSTQDNYVMPPNEAPPLPTMESEMLYFGKDDLRDIVLDPAASQQQRTIAAQRLQDEFGGMVDVTTKQAMESILGSTPISPKIEDGGGAGATGNVISLKEKEAAQAIVDSAKERFERGEALSNKEISELRKAEKELRKDVAEVDEETQAVLKPKADYQTEITRDLLKNEKAKDDAYSKYVKSAKDANQEVMSREDWNNTAAASEVVKQSKQEEKPKDPVKPREEILQELAIGNENEMLKAAYPNGMPEPNAPRTQDDGFFSAAAGFLKNLGGNAGETIAKAASGLMDYIKDSGVINQQELSRAALLYVGSRAMGYDHNASLNYSANQYAQRWDARQAETDKMYKEKKFTEESIDEYRRTGDSSVLSAVKKAPKRVSGTPKKYFTKGKNKAVNLFEFETADGSKYLGMKDGTPVNMDAVHSNPEIVPDTKEFKETRRKNITFISNTTKELVDQTKEQNDGNPVLASGPDVLSNQIGRWATVNNIDVDDMGMLTSQAYADAVAFSQRTGKKVKDITPFLNQQVLRTYSNNTGALMTDRVDENGNPIPINPVKMRTVNDSIAKSLGLQLGDTRVSDISNQYIGAMENKFYNELTPEEREYYNNRALDDENGFLLYMQQDLKISNQLDKK